MKQNRLLEKTGRAWSALEMVRAGEIRDLSSIARELELNVATSAASMLRDFQSAGLAASRMTAGLDDHVNSTRRMAAAMTTAFQGLDGSLFTNPMAATAAIRAAGTHAATRELQRAVQTGALDMLRDLDFRRLAATNASDIMQNLQFDHGKSIGRMMAALQTAELVQGLDGSLVAQSMSAVAAIGAARMHAAIYPEISEPSFASDALEMIAGFHEKLDAGVEAEVESSFTALLEAIFNRFYMYVAAARTAFERESLLSMLTLSVAVLSLWINFRSLEVAEQSADATGRDLDGIRESLDVQTSTQEKHAANIQGLLQQIRDRLDLNTSDEAPRFIVERQVRLRAERGVQSNTITILFPNQVVRLITRQGQWVEVEYYDHLAGSTRSGWVMRKYLKMI